MAATSSTTSTPKRTARIHIKKLPQTLHELVSKSTLRKQQQTQTVLRTLKQDEQAHNNNNESETMLLNNIISSDITYNANAFGPGNVCRIRTPAPHDVLSGRGGSVNAHPGNCQFREWVYVRKEEYNLARSKQAKADICRMIVAKVTALGGRFLTKESPNSQWWVEQDDERVMSKTSQALREGAPKIREAHRDDLDVSSKISRRKAHSLSTNNKSTPFTQQQSIKRRINDSELNGKRVRVDYKGQAVFPNQSSPPLSSTIGTASDLSRNDIPDFQLMPAPALSSTTSIQRPFRFPSPLRSSSSATTSKGYHRSNSLATSDIVNFDGNCEFVNPFEDESFLFDNSMAVSSKPIEGPVVEPSNVQNERNLSESSRASSVMGIKPALKPGLWRETSVSSTLTDFAGYGALLGGINNNNNDSFRSMTPMGNKPLESKSTAHIVPMRSTSTGSVSTAGKDETELSYNRNVDNDDDYDNRSVASEATIGLPLWDWFNRDDATKVSISVDTDVVRTTTTTTTPHEIEPNHHPIPIV